MIVIDKAAWHIDGMSEPKLVTSYFMRIFNWLDSKQLLTEEGKEALKFGIDESISLHEHMVTKEALDFLTSHYDEYLKDHFEDDNNAEKLDALYEELKELD